MTCPDSAVQRTAALPEPRAMLQLLKPVTWFPPMWAFACGVVSSGVEVAGQAVLLVGGIVLAGPMVCGASQVVNDWYDRHVDAINEPRRPIPSGRVPGRWGFWFACFWSALSLVLAATLGAAVLLVTAIGMALAWAYSAPPLRLKQNGWWGNAAVGFCYEGLAWVTGAAVMLGGRVPGWEILVLALLYSLGAHGIMTLNDFKALEGDRAQGIRSLPVQLGPRPAAQFACVVMVVPQLVAVALLLFWEQPWHAAIIGVFVALQLLAMRRLLKDPARYAPWYNGTGVLLSVLGMMVCAHAVRSLTEVAL